MISSDSGDDVPLGKCRKTTHQDPEYVSSGEERTAQPIGEDLGNYELEDEDVSMPDVEVPIVADPANYDPELEPVPASIPSEQQVSSSQVTLDDPPPVPAGSYSHFLGFRLRPVDPLSSAVTWDAYAEEIVEQVSSGTEDPHQIEAQLLFMSTVFGRAGNELGCRRRKRDTKGKGHEH